MNRTLTALIAALIAAAPAVAQTPPPIAPPTLPLLVTYRYWPMQFIQWVGAELPYSMFEVDIDPANTKHPLIYVTLTDRATGKRIHYTDSDILIASAAAVGEEAHKAAIAYDPADNDNNGSITAIRFTMADGKPLQFRFVQGTDMSEQGKGLNPFPGTKIPIFAYRELGAISAEGTALQIGDITSAAAVWTEISQPPYFVAYHAAETEGGHLLVFTPGTQTWKLTSSPSALTPGASWELDEDHGNHRSIHIDKIDGTHLVATSTDRYEPGVQCTVEATRNGDAWGLDQVRFSPVREKEKHSLTISFATPLSPTSENTKFSILAGKKDTLATGSLAATTTASDRNLTLTFSDPKWLSAVALQEQTTATPTGMTLSAHP